MGIESDKGHSTYHGRGISAHGSFRRLEDVAEIAVPNPEALSNAVG